MGNDHSQMSHGVDIEKKAVEVSDFWSHHSATFTTTSENVSNLSVLIGDLFVDGPLWKTHTPLEKNCKNLMVYRHPCIVKYIQSWRKSSKFYLALEEVTPLSHLLGSQSTLQICIGLHSILKAICFLHNKALVSHNNLCVASIYVTREGMWKLGGLEYSCHLKSLTGEYLAKARTSRYGNAIDPNESTNVGQDPASVDGFAFGVLGCEVLKGQSDDDLAALSDFLSICKNDLMHVNLSQRPGLSSLLSHDFFNHDFISIYSFLVEIPLKSDQEKSLFFHTLVDKLRQYPEYTVANLLGNLLLSRIVLLDKAAQEHVLSSVLVPRSDDPNSESLFLDATFKKFIVPRLLQIFSVRDAQIRLLLLSYFPGFVHNFSKDELQSIILPELLLGIKDTNDDLVSVTLHSLADLVPILGAPTVIGGKRGKLFNDGRPLVARVNNKVDQSNPIILANQIIMDLPERPQPDGEEELSDSNLNETSLNVFNEDLDNWEDWEENNPTSDNSSSPPVIVSSDLDVEAVGQEVNNQAKRPAIPDIAELDIQVQAKGGGQTGEEFDFFQDMEPVIKAASKFIIVEQTVSSNKLEVLQVHNEDELGGGDGWVDEEWGEN